MTWQDRDDERRELYRQKRQEIKEGLVDAILLGRLFPELDETVAEMEGMVAEIEAEETSESEADGESWR